jgi:hypothetical protein
VSKAGGETGAKRVGAVAVEIADHGARISTPVPSLLGPRRPVMVRPRKECQGSHRNFLEDRPGGGGYTLLVGNRDAVRLGSYYPGSPNLTSALLDRRPEAGVTTT